MSQTDNPAARSFQSVAGSSSDEDVGAHGDELSSGSTDAFTQGTHVKHCPATAMGPLFNGGAHSISHAVLVQVNSHIVMFAHMSLTSLGDRCP